MTPALALLAGVAFMVNLMTQLPIPIQPDAILSLKEQRPLTEAALFDALAQHRVVLLGENHDNTRHHQIQLAILRALHEHWSGRVMLGLEMFPASMQPTLDKWSAGELSEEAFLDAVQWYDTWGFPPELYLPILRFAREQHLPVIGLNIEREVIRSVRMKGFSNLDEATRARLPDRAPATHAYREFLLDILGGHSELFQKMPFEPFVEAQQTWDSVMADNIVKALRAHPDRFMVSLSGSGHLQGGHGIPHQLRYFGVSDFVTCLPWSQESSWLPVDAADYVWGTPGAEELPPPVILGVQLADAVKGGGATTTGGVEQAGVLIREVLPKTPAAGSALKSGDRILALNGQVTNSRHTLVRHTRALAWGQSVTLQVKREEQELAITIQLPEKPPEPEE